MQWICSSMIFICLFNFCLFVCVLHLPVRPWWKAVNSSPLITYCWHYFLTDQRFKKMAEISSSRFAGENLWNHRLTSLEHSVILLLFHNNSLLLCTNWLYFKLISKSFVFVAIVIFFLQGFHDGVVKLKLQVSLSSRLWTEVKPCWMGLILGWVTTSLGVMLAYS